MKQQGNEKLFVSRLEGVFSSYGRSITVDGIQIWIDAMKRNGIDLFLAMRMLDQHIDDSATGSKLPTPQDVIQRARSMFKKEKMDKIDYSKKEFDDGEKYEGVPIDLLAEIQKRESKILKKTKIFSSQIKSAFKDGILK